MLARDRIAAALARLDVGSRALLELSVRRRLSAEEIADVLRVKPAEVVRLREEAMNRLAADLSVAEEHHAELREGLSRLEGEHWRPGTPAAIRNGRRPRGSRRRGARALAVGLLVLAGGALVALVIASGGIEDEPDRAPPRERPVAADRLERAPEKESAAGPMRTLQRLNGTYGQGSAQLRRKGDRTKLRLRVSRFLRPRGGGYAVWLFNSRADARRLYATADTAIKRDISLPRDFGRYRFVEVARASPRLDSEHGGLSLLRTRVSSLKRERR